MNGCHTYLILLGVNEVACLSGEVSFCWIESFQAGLQDHVGCKIPLSIDSVTGTLRFQHAYKRSVQSNNT